MTHGPELVPVRPVDRPFHSKPTVRELLVYPYQKVPMKPARFESVNEMPLPESVRTQCCKLGTTVQDYISPGKIRAE